jgi:glycosyltransferase involved in cell wall biosynthesis
MPLAARAFSRVHSELVRAALGDPTDLFYGGTTGGLAATAEAARCAKVPYAVDLEDFYSAEHNGTPAGALANELAERIERSVLPGAAFITTASSAIGAAYKDKYGVSPAVVNNTFPLPSVEPRRQASSGEVLKLYWFSQTVGPGRGLEDVIKATGLAGISAELHLRGRAVPKYVAILRRLAAEVAPQLVVVHYEPAPPDLMVSLCNDYDVGLAVEQTSPPSRALCLTNKIFTYLLAGLAVVVTDTPGQRSLARDLAEAAIIYSPGDVATLAEGLKRWAKDKNELGKAKLAAWQAACRRWHWEHPQERGVLLSAVAGVLK